MAAIDFFFFENLLYRNLAIEIRHAKDSGWNMFSFDRYWGKKKFFDHFAHR